jgi:hypothetical protein
VKVVRERGRRRVGARERERDGLPRDYGGPHFSFALVASAVRVAAPTSRIIGVGVGVGVVVVVVVDDDDDADDDDLLPFVTTEKR